jgi:signal transduction histidine kinase
LEVVVEETGNPEAVFVAIREGVKGHAMGPLRVMGMPVLSIANFYRMTVLCQRSYSRLADWKVEAIKPGYACLALEYNHGYAQTKLNCDAIRGFLAGLPQWAGQPPAEVWHHECIVRGATRCVYEITWKEPGKLTVASLLGLLLVGGLAGGFVELFVSGTVELLLFAPMVALSCMLTGLSLIMWKNVKQVSSQNIQEAAELNRALESIHRLNDGLHTLVEHRTSELNDALESLKASREKELLVERHAAIGVLAAGMAHELNNPLNAVALALQGIKEDSQEGSETRELIEAADSATKRCRRIVADIMVYARETKFKPAAVTDIVRAAVALFRTEQAGALTVKLDIPEGIASATCDSGQLQRAIMYLLNNAGEAMNGTGQILVTLRSDATAIMITVKDSGPGLSDAVRNRVFDPFYTAKADGKGGGLGLAITWQIVRQNHGTIEVRSTVGVGTEFEVSLPLSRAGTGEKESCL